MVAKRHVGGILASLLGVMMVAGCTASGLPDASPASSPPRSVTANTLSDADAAFVDRAVARVMADGTVPGVLVSVSSDESQFTAAYGVSDTTTGEPLSTADHFRIGSVTKSFVATAVLQLVDEGRLSLDATLDRYIAGVPGGDRITIRQLLQMRSGLPNYLTEQLQSTWQSDPRTSIWQHSDIVSFLQASPPNFAPGERFEYSNSNYVLLGLILEQVTQQTAEQVVSDLVIESLGLPGTRIPWPATSPDLPEPALHGYDYETGADVTLQNPDIGWMAGNMSSTLADQTRWSKSLVDGDLLSVDLQQQRLSPEPLDADHPDAAGYGLGIIQVGDWFGHGGTVVGYGTDTYYSPTARASIVVVVSGLTLGTASESLANELFAALAQHLYPGSYPDAPAAAETDELGD